VIITFNNGYIMNLIKLYLISHVSKKKIVHYVVTFLFTCSEKYFICFE